MAKKKTARRKRKRPAKAPVQNSGGTATALPVVVDAPKPPGRPFVPGQSGNPGGRPKGVASAVKALLGENGEKGLKALFVIALGDTKEQRAVFGKTIKASVKDRREALRDLLDRGFGRSVLAIEHSGKDGGPIELRPLMARIEEAMSVEEIEHFRALAAKAQSQEPT